MLAVFMMLVLVSRPRAQCEAADNYWLFQHTAFRNTHWMRTLRGYSVSIADQVCALDIRAVSMAGVHPNNWAVASTATGSLYLMRARWIRPTTICASPTFRIDAPVSVPITAAAGMPIHVVNHPSYAADSLLLAVVRGPLLVRVYTVRTSSGSVLRSTDLSVTAANTGQTVAALAGDSDTLGGTDRGLWILGSGGLMRRYSFDGTSWGGGDVYDVDSAYTVYSYGEGFGGTHDGTILALDAGDTFSVASRPASAPIMRISKQGAVGESGTVLVHGVSGWHPYTSGASPYRYFNFVKHTNGSSVELLDSAWEYRLFTYADSATRFSTSDPSEIASSHINDTPYALDGLDHVTLHVADPDSNQVPPSMVTREGGNLLVNADGDTLTRRRPDLLSTYGIIQFAGGPLELTFRHDSALFTTQSLRAATVPGCATSFWKADTFRAGCSFGMYDTLVIALSGDTLRIVWQGPTVASVPAMAPALATNVLRIRSAGCAWTALFSRQLTDITRVELFDALGRTVCTLEPDALASGAVSLDSSVRSPCLFVRVQFHDGAQMVRRMILAR